MFEYIGNGTITLANEYDNLENVLYELRYLIDQYKKQPDVLVNQKLDEINNIINTLEPNNDANSMYMFLIKFRNKLITNPASWINEQIENLYQDLFNLDTTLSDYKSYLFKKVDAERDKHLFGDVPYLFPGDTEQDAIQFRDERDRQNIQDIVISAQIELNKGNIDADCPFMPVSDNIKIMTPAQVMEMGVFLKNRGDNIYSISWIHKYYISIGTTKEYLDNYDYTLAWPEETLNA